jgi:phage repressor protein C with HTH and peptisase S24 domain
VNAPDPRNRLMELVAEHGASLSGLSALIGRNASYLQQFVRKGSPRKLEEGDRQTLARFFGVPESELGGPRDGAAAAPSDQAAGRAPTTGWIDVPRLDLGASAGAGAHAGEEVPVAHLRFSARWLKTQGLDPAMLTAIEVQGDSMEPTLRDGDEILVDRSERRLRAGVHVIRLDDVLLVKRLAPGPAGTIEVISDNPAYGRTVRPRAEVEVIGRVVWKGGRL